MNEYWMIESNTSEGVRWLGIINYRPFWVEAHEALKFGNHKSANNIHMFFLLSDSDHCDTDEANAATFESLDRAIITGHIDLPARD
jgi:hypothetical protein